LNNYELFQILLDRALNGHIFSLKKKIFSGGSPLRKLAFS